MADGTLPLPKLDIAAGWSEADLTLLERFDEVMDPWVDWKDHKGPP